MSKHAPSRPDPSPSGDPGATPGARPIDPPKLLITAGPTHEPIDAVRYLANRSSGRLGIELARAAATRRWPTTLLLGPTPSGIPADFTDEHSDTHPETIRFSSAGDLGSLLAHHAPLCDCLIMAAAVADFRPKGSPDTTSKRRRDADGLTLELEATPDLLAGVARARRPGQILVGFALEPRESMVESARAKLTRKGIDMIVANPLETMDSDRIEAVLIDRDSGSCPPESTPGPIPKAEFATWLLDRIELRLSRLPRPTPGRSENTPNDTTTTGVSF